MSGLASCGSVDAMTLGLPSTSAVSAERARLTKENFYSHTAMSTSIRRHFVDDVDTFTMLAVLREAETGIVAGQHVREIDVLGLEQSGLRIPSEVMEHIARTHDAGSKQMSRILFVCVHDSAYALAVYRKANMKEGLTESSLYIAEQSASSKHGLRLAGTNLDEVWDSICSRVILGNADFARVDHRIAVNRQITALRKEIQRLEKAHARTTQIQMRNRLWDQLQKAREELGQLSN